MGKHGRWSTVAAVALVLAAGLVGCVRAPSEKPAASPSAQTRQPTSAPMPASAFPGLTCDALAAAASVETALGGTVSTEDPSLGDAPLLQVGGVACAWISQSSTARLAIRIAPDGAEYWSAFNSWYEHTDWANDVGEINGTTCSPVEGVCSVHALERELFIEVDVDDTAGVTPDAAEAIARAALSVTPSPGPRPEPTRPPGSRSCDAALSAPQAERILGVEPGSLGYVSATTQRYRLAEIAGERVGALECRLRSSTAEALRFSIIPGGAWMIGPDSPFDEVRRPTRDGSTAFGTVGDDWLTVSLPAQQTSGLDQLYDQLVASRSR